MAMGSYVEKSMDHTTFNMSGGGKSRFNTKSEGIGDTKIGGMFKLFETNLLNINHHAHINFNINIPTGSLSERSDVNTPMGTGGQDNLRMPYPMQIGTGTFDALPGITYTGNYKKLAWGGQYMAEIRMERNQAGYSHGDKHQLTAWGSYEWARYFSTSARVIYKTQERIKGQDPAISAMVQTADPRNHGGRQLGVAFGVNLAGQKGILKGHRLSTEIIIPLYRDLHGPQLETDWRIVAGWQYASSFLQ
jgi:hypothetical protein